MELEEAAMCRTEDKELNTEFSSVPASGKQNTYADS